MLALVFVIFFKLIVQVGVKPSIKIAKVCSENCVTWKTNFQFLSRSKILLL